MPIHTHPGWQKHIAYNIWEYYINGCTAHLCILAILFVICSCEELAREGLYVDFSVGSHFLALKEHRYCVHSHRSLYILANPGSVTHATFTPFLTP